MRAGAPGVLSFFLVSLLACSRGRAPAPPAAPPASTAPVVPAASLAPPISRFDVPLTYDFTDVLATVERVVPKTFGSMDSVRQDGDDDRKHYAFSATRGPFTTFVKGAEVHLRTTLTYTARGWYKPFVGPTLSAGCGMGRPRPRIVAELVAPLTLTPAWHLRSKARIATLAPATDGADDRCRISFLAIDVTGHVLHAARVGLEGRLHDIDAKVANVDLTNRATGWWSHLSEPIRLSDNVWLLLQPQQLRLKGVKGEGHLLHVAAGMDAYPTIVTGPRPAVSVTPLPPLGSDSGVTGFRVSLAGTVDFATASQVLTRELRGKTVRIGGRTVRVGALRASRSAQGKLALSVAFTGDATGTVQCIGTPTYNRAANAVEVNDLDFDLSTDKVLLNAYAWLRSPVLLAFFRDKARFPMASILERGGHLLELGINRTIGDVLRIGGTVDSLAILGVYVTPSGMTVRALVIGSGSVSVRTGLLGRHAGVPGKR